MIELIIRILNKFITTLYKIVNWKTLRNATLYGTPRLIARDNIIVGKGVRINGNVFIHGAGGVTIKENVTLSYGVTLLSTAYDTSNWSTNKVDKIHKNENIIIGKNVWLCANVTVLPGIEIADDIIIAAGAVVTKNLLESGWIYAGVPAKKIRKI
ncbi:DapH/DapD/GlmU-related protein [Globicatella sulfidifaciens]|uniref:acyltransferase n=1 Tax=Globicatella sulfidifaciens TaxID=136093 RepID=UPI00288EBC04|nr:DapH/DapD/GlmU-related protein [Globicatella sulfidifaciens]MDT2767637.1 DapH/DapD/GlmU-related protein [Globicatella sulfidifaciens]